MLVFHTYRELRGGKRLKTNSGHLVSKNGSVEDNRASNWKKTVDEEVLENHIMNREVVNE